MTLSIQEIGPIGNRAVRMLAGSVFRSPSRWKSCVLVFTDTASPRIVPRSELASELYDDDLDSLAHECLARHVGPGQVLAMVNVEVIGRAPFAKFVVLQLRNARGVIA